MEVEILASLPDFQQLSERFQLVVDAIFGFSFKPPIREPFGQVLKELSQLKIPLVSIDIPSGLSDYWM